MDELIPGASTVEIIVRGRCGTVVYREGSYSASFDWEFGGGDIVAIIYVGLPWEWNERHPWASGRRRDILERVVSEVIRQKAPTCIASFDEANGAILLRVEAN